jgi:hypothetical protein
MSHYNTLKKYTSDEYHCKYCEYWTFTKKLIKKHQCDGKKENIKMNKEVKQ